MQLNPWLSFSPEQHQTEALRPDGDVNLSENYSGFKVPECEQCGGVLKPDVVFFGANVPPDVRDRATALVDEADAVLALGTSLAVFSAYRLVRQALDRKLPVAVVNSGPTRADQEAAIKLDAKLGDVLPTLFDLPSSFAH